MVEEQEQFLDYIKRDNMKLKDYLENLNKLVAENPEALDYKVLVASDEEGNNYDEVCYGPSIGFYDTRDFSFTDDSDSSRKNTILNAICIN